MTYRATEEQKQKRLQDFKAWFKAFADDMKKLKSIDIAFEPDAALHVNTTYWELLDNDVRTCMVGHKNDDSYLSRVDHHKIASLTELVVAAT